MLFLVTAPVWLLRIGCPKPNPIATWYSLRNRYSWMERSLAVVYMLIFGILIM